MKTLCFILLAFPLVVFSKECKSEDFAKFKESFKKIYKDDIEEHNRCKVFTANLAEIEEHNAKFDRNEVTFKKGINKFSDLTSEEFTRLHTGLPQVGVHSRAKRSGVSPLVVPTTWNAGNLDLRVSTIPVKNMGGCGCPYVFAATGVYEYYLLKNYNTSYDLSEQMGVDCARPNGCSGGWMHEVFDYYLTHGVNFESVYPYKATAGVCGYKTTTNPANGLPSSYSRQWYTVPANERTLAYTVFQTGWVAVSINAATIWNYSSGIVSAAGCSSNPNHVVIIVGYGYDTTVNKNYWIMRNSWGSSWGDNGYFKMERGVGACGITNLYAYYRVHIM